MTSLNDIQQAIYTKLTSDTTLKSMVKGVFDAVPQNQPFPYIVIGEATEVPFNTFGRVGRDSTFTIHIWSQYNGFREALSILEEMNRILDGTTLNLPDLSLVYIVYENAFTLVDGDGATRHVPARYRVVVQG